MSRISKTPAYCLHRASGRAVVRIDGRDYYLGAYDSEESRQRYDALIAEWLANGRTLAGVRQIGDGGGEGNAGPSINELLLAYWRWAESYHRDEEGRPTQELQNLKEAIKPLRRLYGLSPAREFGPMALRAIQSDLALANLARTVVNARIGRIKRFFKWAVSYGLLPATVFQALQTVPGLKRGRCQARESDPVRPVPVDDVKATLPFLPGPVAGMVRLQLLTGCRAGEAMAMKAEDLDTSGPVWCWRPSRHKNTHRGRDRVIFLGPQAQEAVRPFLRVRCPHCDVEDLPQHIAWRNGRCGPCDDRRDEGGTLPLPSSSVPAGDYFLFSPRNAMRDLYAARNAVRKTKPRKGKKVGIARRIRERYDRHSYHQTVERACGKPASSRGPRCNCDTRPRRASGRSTASRRRASSSDTAASRRRRFTPSETSGGPPR